MSCVPSSLSLEYTIGSVFKGPSLIIIGLYLSNRVSLRTEGTGTHTIRKIKKGR